MVMALVPYYIPIDLYDGDEFYELPSPFLVSEHSLQIMQEFHAMIRLFNIKVEKKAKAFFVNGSVKNFGFDANDLMVMVQHRGSVSNGRPETLWNNYLSASGEIKMIGIYFGLPFFPSMLFDIPTLKALTIYFNSNAGKLTITEIENNSLEILRLNSKNGNVFLDGINQVFNIKSLRWIDIMVRGDDVIIPSDLSLEMIQISGRRVHLAQPPPNLKKIRIFNSSLVFSKDIEPWVSVEELDIRFSNFYNPPKDFLSLFPNLQALRLTCLPPHSIFGFHRLETLSEVQLDGLELEEGDMFFLKSKFLRNGKWKPSKNALRNR